MSLSARRLAEAPTSNSEAPRRPPVALASASLADGLVPKSVASTSPAIVRGLVRLTEFAFTIALGCLVAVACVDEPGVMANPLYLAAIAFAAAVTVSAAELLGLNTISAFSAFTAHWPRLTLASTVAFTALVVVLTLFKAGAEVSRLWLGTWYLATLAALTIERLVLAQTMRRLAKSGRLYQRVAIYGSGAVTEDLIARFEADPHPIVRIAGIFDDRDDVRAPRLVRGYPRLGNLTTLISMSRSARFDLIIVALPLAAEERLSEVAKALSVLPADIKLPAGATRLRFSPRTYSYVGSVAMIDLYDRPLADWNTVSKWLFDKAVGTLALVLLAPVMAAVALAVKFDSRGPVLFRQKRYGFNNELIEVYKFRSMYTDRCDAAAAKLVTKDDPRVTRVGRIIRKASLDELPQLINVVLGDLSLVGPRPHALQAKAGDALYDDVVDGYFARHKVKPGITGWAQINGWRGETDTPEKIQKRVEHDLYYIENWSLALDVLILAKTPVSLLKTENAY